MMFCWWRGNKLALEDSNGAAYAHTRSSILRILLSVSEVAFEQQSERGCFAWLEKKFDRNKRPNISLHDVK